MVKNINKKIVVKYCPYAFKTLFIGLYFKCFHKLKKNFKYFFCFRCFVVGFILVICGVDGNLYFLFNNIVIGNCIVLVSAK